MVYSVPQSPNQVDQLFSFSQPITLVFITLQHLKDSSHPSSQTQLAHIFSVSTLLLQIPWNVFVNSPFQS